MATDNELRDLLSFLEQGMQQKSLKWKKTPTDTVFRMDLSDEAYVRLIRDDYLSEDEEGAGRYILQLFNSASDLLDEWSSAEVPQPESTKLAELFRLARRSALDVENQIHQILKKLQEKVSG